MVDSYQDTGSSDAFTPIGQALVNSSTQASARSAIGIDFVTTAQAVAGAINTGAMNPVLTKNSIHSQFATLGAFATTAQAVSGLAATGFMNPVLTRNAIESLVPEGYIPNSGYALARYYNMMDYAPNGGGVAVVANRLYFIPYIIGSSVTFNRIGFNVTSGVAGNARIGIYNLVNGVPTTLVLDAGTVTTNTIGEKEVSFSQLFTPGLYALAVVFDATPSVNAAQSVTNIFLGGSTGTDNSQCTGYMSHAYAALPANFGAVTYLNGGEGANIWMRRV